MQAPHPSQYNKPDIHMKETTYMFTSAAPMPISGVSFNIHLVLSSVTHYTSTVQDLLSYSGK